MVVSYFHKTCKELKAPNGCFFVFSTCFSFSRNTINFYFLSVQSFDAFLNDCRSLVSIDISGLDTSTCTQFSQMFEACIALIEIIGIENLDVSNASKYSFSEMFHCCKSLKKLDLSLWDTSKADNFARMFGNCEKLETLTSSHV